MSFFRNDKYKDKLEEKVEEKTKAAIKALVIEPPQEELEIESETIVFDKLADRYKWTYKEFKETPYTLIIQLLKLISNKEKSLKEILGQEELMMLRVEMRKNGEK